MTPKERERLGRLRRRADYLDEQIEADKRARQTHNAAHNWRRAERSALVWAIGVLEHVLGPDTPPPDTEEIDI